MSDEPGRELAPLATSAAVKGLLTRHHLQPRHTLGQNFIVRPEAVMAATDAAAIGSDDTVLEIGPGLGTLTQAIAARAGRVLAIELDRGLMPVLSETVGGLANVTLVFGDARKQDFAALVAPAQAERAKAVANLPYYVTTALLEQLIWSPARFDRIVVLVQAEAVGRIIAGPSADGYGPLALLVECFYSASAVMRVPRDAFWPQPKVDSALLTLRRRPDAPTPSEAGPLFALIRAGFGQRRKTLAAGLALNREPNFPSCSREVVSRALAAAGLPAAARAEQLSLSDFYRLQEALGIQVTQQ